MRQHRQGMHQLHNDRIAFYKCSMMRFIAMSRVLNLATEVVYPSVNGTDAIDFKIMHTTLRPPFAETDTGRLTLMWSTLSLPASQPWQANHVVPLVDGIERGPIFNVPEASIEIHARKTEEQKKTFASKNVYYVHCDRKTKKEVTETTKYTTMK